MNDSSCAPAHNAPLPLRRSPPASFKRMLGRGFLARTPPPSPIRRDLDASAHQQDDRRTAGKHGETRSEEHTSELQSRLHHLCRRLLEKSITSVLTAMFN